MTNPSPPRTRSRLFATVVLLASVSACRHDARPDAAAVGASAKYAMTTTCRTKHDAAAIREAAQAALVQEWHDRLTPLLPDRWPQPQSANFYTFESVPLPTGAVTYSVRGPVRQVVFDNPAGPPRIIQFKRQKPLGHEHFPACFGQELPTKEALVRAEQALLDFIAGCQTLESLLPKLEPYREWFCVHPVVTTDVRQRLPAFMKWLLSTWPAYKFPGP